MKKSRTNQPPRTGQGNTLIIRNRHFASRLRQIHYLCGHLDQPTFEIRLFGRTIQKKEEEKEFCGFCLAKRFNQDCIRCVRCGMPILETEAITYYETSTITNIPLHARILIPVDYKRDAELPHLILGCANASCMPHGAIPLGQFREGLIWPSDKNAQPFQIPLFSSWKRIPHVFPHGKRSIHGDLSRP